MIKGGLCIAVMDVEGNFGKEEFKIIKKRVAMMDILEGMRTQSLKFLRPTIMI